MAFRDNIEAIFKAKDAGRFTGAMKAVGKSIRGVGKDADKTSVEFDILKDIAEKLERQTVILGGGFEFLAGRIDEAGDEAVQAAAKMELLNRAGKRSGSNAVFLGKSWAFWKDRLSLTRSEILTTALTIGLYLSPALIALGSSFTMAMFGGGAVGAGGLAAFLFGLGTLGVITKTVAGQVDKITKAQDQYNLAVQQYGAASEEASRASAHLFAVIQENGGADVQAAADRITALSDAWTKLTGSARRDLLRTLGSGIGAANNLLPTVAGSTNQMASSLRKSLQVAFKQLSGGEIKTTLKVLGNTFSDAIGPGVRGATDLIIVLARILRASAPWVVKWSKAWAATMHGWRRGTKDAIRLQQFIDSAVRQFKAWWGLAKELARTLRIIFSATKDDGGRLVVVLTSVVKNFNDWLQAMKDTGRLRSAFNSYLKSLHDVAWAFQHPVEAIRKWLPIVMDAVATTMATHAPDAAMLFLDAFIHSGAWAQFLTVAFFAKKFGFFKSLGKSIGKTFVDPFTEAFMKQFALKLGIEAGAEGAIGRAAASAGATAGTLFGVAFGLGAAALIGYYIGKALVKISGSKAWNDVLEAIHAPTRAGKAPGADKIIQSAANPKLPDTRGIPSNPQASSRRAERRTRHRNRRLGGGALGGVVPPSGQAIVGEQGPELATHSPRGTRIIPLHQNSRQYLQPIDIPNLQQAMRITVNTSVQINRREIARAVADEAAYNKARRGGD